MSRIGRPVATSCPASAPHRVRRLNQRRWQALALAILLVLTSSGQQLLADYASDLGNRRRTTTASIEQPPVNPGPDSTVRAQVAPPPASGAYAPYPLNHTLDAEPVYPGGEVTTTTSRTPLKPSARPPAATTSVLPLSTRACS